jgi:hypothetical protein
MLAGSFFSGSWHEVSAFVWGAGGQLLLFFFAGLHVMSVLCNNTLWWLVLELLEGC